MADRIFLARSGSDQLLEGDRKAADANPGRVPHSIGDRPGRARNADLTDAQAADLQGGRWYINIHTNANRGGEIRGQVVK